MKKDLLKKIIAGTIIATTLLGSTVFASGTWSQANGHWYLTGSNGVYQTGWQMSGNFWYFMDSNGVMQTGWKYVGGHWYYLNPSGDMATGWKLAGGKWYYLNPSGDMAIGWKLVGEKWYYLNPNGDMAFSTTVGGYTLGADGAWITATTGNTGSGTNTGGSTVWIPSSGEVRTIAGISTNMTRDQLTALSIEAPENAIANGLLQPIKLPKDGKMYHYREKLNFGGIIRYSDSYCKYLSSFVGSNGIAKYHFLEIDCSGNNIVSFADIVE